MLFTIIGSACVLYFSAILFREIFVRDKTIGLALLAFWLIVAALAASGAFTFAVFPPLPIRFMGVLLLFWFLSYRSTRVRRLWNSIPAQTLILLHTVRAPIGILFIISGVNGTIGPEFGQRA